MMRVRPGRFIIGWAGVGLVLASCVGGAESRDDLTELLQTRLEQHPRLPSLGAVVIVEGTIRGAGAVGLRKRGHPAMVTLDDKFHLGSCTKAFTATLAAVLVEEGRIEWGTALGESLRGLRPGLGWEGVTLEQLLTNTGGFPGSPPPEVWARAWTARGSATRQRELFLKDMLKEAPRFSPGGGFEYSNAGYAAAGAMLESAGGKSWEDLIRTKIFEPLGMKSGGFGAPASERDTPDQPWGHDAEGKPVAPGPGSDNPLAIAPAGAIQCSLPDLARFALLHMQRARDRVLTRESSFEKLHAPVREGYAMGWAAVERPWAGGPALTHMGSNTMFTALLWIAPERGFAAIVVSNMGQEAAAKACDEVVGDLVTRYLE